MTTTITARTARRNSGIYNLREVARLLNVSYKVLFNCKEAGLIPPPKVSFGAKRKYYTADDIEEMKELLEV